LFATLLLVSGCNNGGGGGGTEPAGDSKDYMVLKSTDTLSFEDVMLNLQLAITDRGYKIDNHAFIGAMLERTKESLGETKTVYIEAQQYRFCPSRYSRNMLGSDPHNIVFCPYVINVYHTPEEPKRIYISFRKPLIVGSEESKQALRDVDKLLNELVDEALRG